MSTCVARQFVWGLTFSSTSVHFLCSPFVTADKCQHIADSGPHIRTTFTSNSAPGTAASSVAHQFIAALHLPWRMFLCSPPSLWLIYVNISQILSCTSELTSHIKPATSYSRIECCASIVWDLISPLAYISLLAPFIIADRCQDITDSQPHIQTRYQTRCRSWPCSVLRVDLFGA